MTNREYLAWVLDFGEYENDDVAEIIADELESITDEDDCSLAVIYGDDKRRLAEWLGEEAQG